jgi:hypothetical protein
MRDPRRPFQVLLILLILVGMGACAYPGPYYQSAGPPPPSTEPYSDLRVGINDRNFVMQIYDRTSIGFRRLPQSEQLLYDKGYDRVRRERDADFSIDVTVSAGLRDNPDVRAGQALGGALAGAAAGAIIGGALGDPGPGAAIGAASGGLLGLAAPAATSVARIDINIQSFSDGRSSFASATVDLTHVAPPDAYHVIDGEIARMLQVLPRR